MDSMLVHDLQFKVFVYGTLLQGEYNHRVAEPFLINVEEGSIMGHLHTVGPYPALVVDEENGQEIKGQWFTVNEVGLKNMDRLEGFHGKGSNFNHYDRVQVKDLDGVREGFVYVYTAEKVKQRNLRKIESGSWKTHQAERQVGTY
jgi:gamma-glutamylcyclotransferase (GGCT)/AIG2-like uncharacterized protein YtfP